MRQKQFRMSAALLLLATCAFGQQQHVQWSVRVESDAAPPGGKVLARVTGRVDPEWHLYAASSKVGIPTSFQVGPDSVVERVRLLQPAPKKAFDPIANAEAETYEGEVVFLLDVALKANAPGGNAALSVSTRYQTCNATNCVPGKWTGTAPLNIAAGTAAVTPAIPASYMEVQPPAASTAGSDSAVPVQSQGWGLFLLAAFGFGLASIFTPCVFPMIPITMSYFLNRQSGGRRDGVVQAVVFCLGIIVLFSGIGLATTAILGPAGVKSLGGNPWVNGFIAALFIAFGLSLLGAFEITIPSSVLTKLNQSSEKGGFAGTLLMGLTFSLSSFACVGPFVGTLLAASVGGGASLRPLLGMVVFATGLALPFFLLALFPSYLKKLPRSGGWMARVKVVMGFVILAASLKYLASLDLTLHWGFLTRERFLAAWIVLFAMAGLYLLGFLRMEGVKPDEPTGLGRLLCGIAFLIFAISLAPGMFGGKLGDLEAYVPEGSATSAIGGGAPADGGLVWLKDQYRGALEQARREGKLVFIDFTGYACANCHWMRANMLARPEIAAMLKKFVLVELYTDGTDAASEANAKLEAEKFKTVSLPFYVILDPDEKVMATFDRLTKDPGEYLAFLEKGSGGAAATASAAGPAIGPVTAMDGGNFDASGLKGKVAVVNFWATWCVPCISEMPGFVKLHQDYGSKGVTVLGVAMDEDGAAPVKRFMLKHPIPYALALGGDAVYKENKIEALPVTLVFDRSGKVIKRFDGLAPEAELTAAVKAAL